MKGDAMDTSALSQGISHRLTFSGVLLLLLSLITGLAVPKFANPRMGLASHVEGMMSGILLTVLGGIWPKLRLGKKAMNAACLLSVYGAYATWLNPLLAAAWDAGGTMMPEASKGKKGTAVQETVISILAVSLVLAMLPAVFIVFWGLRTKS
jgi:(hydroxyamino)benzene mutase